MTDLAEVSPPTLSVLTASSWTGSMPPAGQVDPAPTVDYQQVRTLRRRVEARLAAALADQPGLARDGQHRLAHELIDAAVRTFADEQAAAGTPITPAGEAALAGAVFDSIYGLGRLQPLIDDPEIEDIEIAGADVVWLTYADGRRLPGPPVADSDAELVELLQTWAAWGGQTARQFSTAHPLLRLRLPDGSRLTAAGTISPVTHVAIRRHRLLDVDLADLRRRGVFDQVLEAFLRAAVTARLNVVICGVMGAGKTTLMRALANELPVLERVGTLETEFELGLHLLPARHAPGRVVALECRDGNSEDDAGRIDLSQLVTHALRLNLRRLLVGEVRAEEIIPMLEAMASGGDGSFCTLHVKRGVNPLTRMVSLAMRGPAPLTESAACHLIATAVDLIVQLDYVDEIGADGLSTRRRAVSDVWEVTGVGEAGRVATNHLFGPGPDGLAVPATPPARLAELTAAGFDPTLWDSAGAGWPAEGGRAW
jgi:Flp pilus assembly CpaF family ATPase